MEQGGVLVCLAADEERPHEEGQRVPLPKAPAPKVEQSSGSGDLAALGGEHAHLAGERARDQHTGIDDRERDVDQRGLTSPERHCAGRCGLGVGHVPDGEVGRKQSRKEHQLRREPDDRTDGDRLGAILPTTQA